MADAPAYAAAHSAKDAPAGWNLEEFLTAIGVILFSALLMYVMAKTLLINPLERNRRQFQFYNEAQLRRDRAEYRAAPAAAAVAGGALLLGAALENGEEALEVSTSTSRAAEQHETEDQEEEEDEDEDEQPQDWPQDDASRLRLLKKQRRQIETLEAVNDMLCAENEKLEAKVAAVRKLVT